MTGRDRLILIFIGAVAILGVAYLLVVSPERKRASAVATEASTATTRLASAESKLGEAREAQARYSAAYASIVSLGKAVPTSEEIPSLIDELAQLTHQKDVDFSSIVAGSGSGSSSSAAAPAAGAAVSAGFTQMPFTFIFNGSYTDLEHFFHRVDHNVIRTASNQVRVYGRLLTIQSVKLSPLPSSGNSATPSNELTGAITATAYVLPPSQSATTGATASAPAGSATPASSGSAGTPTAAPAVARVTP